MKIIIIIFLLVLINSCRKNQDIKIEFQKQKKVSKSLKYKKSFMKMNQIISEYSDFGQMMTRKYKLDDANYALVNLEKHMYETDDFKMLEIDQNIFTYFNDFTIDTNKSKCFVDIVNYDYTYYTLNHRNSDYYERYPMILLNQHCDVDSLYVGIDFLCIQEALDKDGIWKPINRLPDFPTMFFNMEFKKKEFVVILLPKYEGNFKTKMRIRWRSGKKVYLSNTFWGEINRNFLLEKKDILFYKDKQHRTSKWINGRFLGNEFSRKLIDEIKNK